MSGNRYKKPDDIIKARQEYLDTLAQTISLQDRNEQAVRLQKETGQLPPASQMKDNRTVEQKLLDFEKLKQSIREDLSPIADPQLANMIIQYVINSPFNQDNGLLIFFAQRAPDLVENLKRIYKFGIKGDENDARQFVSFIEKFYTDKNNITSNAKQFMARLGANSQMSLTKKASQQAELLNRLEAEVNRILLEVEKSGIPGVYQGELAGIRSYFTSYIEVIKEIYPNDQIYVRRPSGVITLEDIESSFNSFMLNPYVEDGISDDYKLFIGYINHNIPNTDYLNTLVTTLNRNAKIFLKFKNEINYEKVIVSINNIFEQLNTGETFDELFKVRSALKRILDFLENQFYAGLVPPGGPGMPPGGPGMPPGGPPLPGPDDDYDDDDDEDSLNPFTEFGRFVGSIPSMFRRYPAPEPASGSSEQAYGMEIFDQFDMMKKLLGNIFKENYTKYKSDKLFTSQLTRFEKTLSDHASQKINTIKAIELMDDIYSKLTTKHPSLSVNEEEEPQVEPTAPPYDDVPFLEPVDDDIDDLSYMPRAPDDEGGPGEGEVKEEEPIRTEDDLMRDFGSLYRKLMTEADKSGISDELKVNDIYLTMMDLVGGGQYGSALEMAETLWQRYISNELPKGRGLKKRVIRGRGLSQPKKLKKFGRYYLDENQLSKNIFSLSDSKGSGIASLKPFQMSRPLSNVVKKMTGNGVLNDKDFYDLTDAEKRYLYKIASESDHNSKMKIPTPAKDNEERDVHLFNVYKGEIMAGNDSRELVNKFKALLMKLSKSGKININEVNEIMELLKYAGY